MAAEIERDRADRAEERVNELMGAVGQLLNVHLVKSVPFIVVYACF